MIGELSEDLIMTGDEIDVDNLFSDDGGEEETQVTPHKLSKILNH